MAEPMDKYEGGEQPGCNLPGQGSCVIETYPIDHLTEWEMQRLREVMGFHENWAAEFVRIPRDSPKFVELQALLVGAGINAALRR